MSTTDFITRHPGARTWANAAGIAVDEIVTHFDPGIVRPRDLVIGSLPVHLIAAVCRRGGRDFHLSMDGPPACREQALTAEELSTGGARIDEFHACLVCRRDAVKVA